MFKFFFFYNYFTYNLKILLKNNLDNFLFKTYFLVNYYLMNELIWQEGLLIDFLQKKVIDNWIKRFLIYSSYLFSERLVFDNIIRFYLDLIIWPSHKLSIFEFNNVGNTLFITVFFFFFFFFIFLFIYLFILMF